MRSLALFSNAPPSFSRNPYSHFVLKLTPLLPLSETQSLQKRFLSSLRDSTSRPLWRNGSTRYQYNRRITLKMEVKVLLSLIFRYFKMKTSSKRKKNMKKVRRERITFFNKVNNFSLNNANVYVIIEYNGKYFIYNSRPDKEWPSLEVMLVSDIAIALFSAKMSGSVLTFA
jgi:hypothetical protein